MTAATSDGPVSTRGLGSTWTVMAGGVPLPPPNEKAYDEHVAGRPVLTTLREAQDFLFMRAIQNMVTDTSGLP
jgi:hypothetical protein